MKRNEFEKMGAKLRKLQGVRRKNSMRGVNDNLVLLSMCVLGVIAVSMVLLNPLVGAGFSFATAGFIALAKSDADLTTEEKQLLGTIEKKLNDKFGALKSGLITQDQFSAFTAGVEKQLAKYNEDGQWKSALKDLDTWKQSIKDVSEKLDQLQKKGGLGYDSLDMKEFTNGILPDLKKWYETGNGAGTNDEMPKYKGVMSIANNTLYDGVAPSVFAGISDYERIYERRRPDAAFILNLVTMINTNKAAITYTEEVGQNGDAQLVAEGGLKPNIDYSFEDKTSKAQKIAAHFTITEELLDDAPRLAAKIEQLFTNDVRLKFHKHILDFMISNAQGYVATTLDGQIENPNFYDVVGASIAQMQSFDFTPDALVINPQDAILGRLAKSTTGQYIISPFKDSDMTLTVYTSNLVAPGNFVLADTSVVNVEIYKDYSLRYGWINDDLIKNQFTAVGEIRAHVYLPDNNKQGLIAGDYSTIAAVIEAP